MLNICLYADNAVYLNYIEHLTDTEFRLINIIRKLLFFIFEKTKVERISNPSSTLTLG